MEYVDTHCHLPMLTHAPLETILQRANASNVTKLLTVATELANWESSRALAEKYDFIYFSLGLHPHYAKEWKNSKQSLDIYCTQPLPLKCVAIGEIGLDYHYQLSSKQDQLFALEEQLQFATKMGLPVILHCRNAFSDLYALFKRFSLRGVMHCFTGTYQDAKDALDLGLKISFSGIITFKNALDLRQVAAKVPITETLVETDCPYLAPVPFRGQTNEPSYLPFTGKLLAALHGVTEEKLCQQTTENAVKLFGL